MGEEPPESGAVSGAGGGDSQQNPKVTTHKGKSCKGCLYFSSALKSDARKPICIGITRNLPQVPSYIVGESEMEAAKEGRGLSNFKYTCVGYSVFLDNKDNPPDEHENLAELPFCAGIEIYLYHYFRNGVGILLQLLVDRRPSTAGNSHDNVQKEDATVHSQPRAPRPAHTSADKLYNRFTRNAGLVAAGVARNLNKVGNHVKEVIDDILYPYRRGPK